MSRTRQSNWDRLNMRSASTRLTLAEYDAFLAACRAAKTNPYWMIKKAIWQFIEENGVEIVDKPLPGQLVINETQQ